MTHLKKITGIFILLMISWLILHVHGEDKSKLNSMENESKNLSIDIDISINSDSTSPDNDASTTGKILSLNILDKDYDGLPDYLDGFDFTFGGTSQSAANASHAFVPVKVKISNVTDYSKVVLKFEYLASDPANFSYSGSGSTSDPYTFTGPDSDTARFRLWKKDGSEARNKASVVNNGDFIPKDTNITLNKIITSGDEFTLYLEALDASKGIGLDTIKVSCKPLSSQDFVSSDQVKFTAVKVESVHPVDSDFQAKAGRIIISTRDGDSEFYSSAQTKGGEVKITAYVTPAIENVDVYFEVIDPDDLSPYEPKLIYDQLDDRPNDNLHDKAMDGSIDKYKLFQGSFLSVKNAKTVVNNSKAIAETVLKFSTACSGDNFIVRATCRKPDDNPFDTNTVGNGTPANQVKYSKSQIAQSCTLVAWKRAYIEEGQMYASGATVTAAAASTSNTLELSNNPFRKNTPVVIFLPPNGATTIERTITDVEGLTITLDSSLGQDVLIYSGVKFKSTFVPQTTVATYTGSDSKTIKAPANCLYIDINSEITIVDGGTSINRIVKSLTYTTDGAYVYYNLDSKLGVDVQEGAIVKLRGMSYDEVKTNKLGYLEMAYGKNTNGVDSDGNNGENGGAFIEYKTILTHKIPCFQCFANSIQSRAFFKKWFINQGKTNIMMYSAAILHPDITKDDGTELVVGGLAYDPDRMAATFQDKYRPEDASVAIPNTEVHEIGHIWGILPSEDSSSIFYHVDRKINHKSHTGQDECFMSYNTNQTDGKSELCLDCLMYVRQKQNF